MTKVPKYYTPINDDVYASGSFNSWQPKDPIYKFTKLTHNTYKLNVSIPLGGYQFKLTRGTWDSGECSLDGSFMANRNLAILSDKLTIKLTVSNWDDFKGKHTATGNTNILDRSYPYPQFGNTKRIWIYLPSDYYTSIKKYPVIYMHDAQNLFDDAYSFAGEWQIDEAMENFFQQRKETAIIVGIETTVNRMDELTPYANPTYGGGKADLYVDFLVNNLKPYIDNHFRTKSDRFSTGIIGSSLGGLFSFYAALKNQEVFGKVGIFSPSFWFNSRIYDFAVNTPLRYGDIKLYFFCGAKESQSMVPDMQNMINKLIDKGYTNIKTSIAPDGAHNEFYWRREFPASYEWLFLN